MKLSFFKATHFLLVVMATHLATVVAPDPDPSQYMKNSNLNKEIADIDGSQEKFNDWDFVKRFWEGVGAGIGYSNYTIDSIGAGWDGKLIKYDHTKHVTVLFADKGGNTDNGFCFALQRLIKLGKQFIVHLGRDATEKERLEAYIVEIAGYIKESGIAANVGDLLIAKRYDLIESLKKHITQLPNRQNAQQNKKQTVDTETAVLMDALKKIYNNFKGEKQTMLEKLLKIKIEESVDREIPAKIIEAKFLTVLTHYENLGLQVIRQTCDKTRVTANDPDVAPILLFAGGISIVDAKAGAGRKGATIMVKAVRELIIMHFLVDNYATDVTAMDIQSYISNTVDPDPKLEQWEKDALTKQMHLPVTPNLTIVIGQFTQDHVEKDGQKFIQIIYGPVLDKITAFNNANKNILKETSVKNYTVYRVDITSDDMPNFHIYESDYTAFLKLIQGGVASCPFTVTKGVCTMGNLEWDANPLVL